MNRKRKIATLAIIATVFAGSGFAGVPGGQDADSNDMATTGERGQMFNLLRDDLMETSEESAVAIKSTWYLGRVLGFAQEQNLGQRDADQLLLHRK